MLKIFPQLFVKVWPAYLKKGLNQAETFPAGCWSFTEECESQICLGWRWHSKTYHSSKKSRCFKQKFHQNSLDQQITGENFAVLSTRVNTTLELIPTDVVDRTILSMNKRNNNIIKLKGQRNKNYFFTWKYFQMHWVLFLERMLS